MKVRFAPSPTGRLHIGNARMALMNWLCARANNGTFVLRIDDTDTTRSKPEYTEGILEDMFWLGLHHDVLVHQSSRFVIYREAAEKLRAMGRLYPCYETAEELDYKRKLQRSRGLPPIYDRSALTLSEEEKKAFEAKGIAPHWRFKLEDGAMSWDDLVCGPVSYGAQHLSDPVLIREDGVPLYTFASVVDDLEFEITHVIRGQDHVTNTAVQLQLMEALGGNPKQFTFAHLPMIMDEEGGKFSKRTSSLSINELRKDGIEPFALLSMLARLGTSHAAEPLENLAELLKDFDLTHYSKGSCKFSFTELDRLNAKQVASLPYAAVRHRLPEFITEGFWMGIRGNLEHVSHAEYWWKICQGEGQWAFQETDLALVDPMLAACDMPDWKEFVGHMTQATGLKGKNLFMPLRRILTGEEHGPELGFLWSSMGPAVIRRRLEETLEKRG